MKLISVVLAAACLALAGAARAGSITDHLKCYKVKDSHTKESRGASLATSTMGFENEAGCTVKLPAKLLCNHVQKNHVQPPPPNMAFGQNLVDSYLCYALKCPKRTFDHMVMDQLASRTVTLKGTRYLCSPASISQPM
jgi:hypothetical protein